ncbi:ABC-type sugar transport system ATPase subunit [Streptosporangium album]|uniref:ABC-type sugar transport system ATPase subunit n=1 Tax=Streptosporangium album TaxID=47479 RepID=A0A7W7S337_9ACTN|nr:ATP-binding cassette domain-containing protein [Streptosporangium album]MBB4942935.1 ABC-type sugar transport system ATPase subunit [Streptosporangium album]
MSADPHDSSAPAPSPPPGRGATAVLSAANISQHFGHPTALSDVSLEVAPGEVPALVGGTGADESTLVKIMAGVQAPGSGEMRLAGQPE